MNFSWLEPVENDIASSRFPSFFHFAPVESRKKIYTPTRVYVFLSRVLLYFLGKSFREKKNSSSLNVKVLF